MARIEGDLTGPWRPTNGAPTRRRPARWRRREKRRDPASNFIGAGLTSDNGCSVHPGGNGDHLVLAREREALSAQQTLADPPLRRVALRVTLLS